MTNAKKSRAAAAEKAALLRRQQAIQERNRRIAIVASIVVIVVAVVGGVAAVIVHSNKKTPSVALTGVQTYKGLSRNHVEGTVKYAQNPPVGGNHNPVWLNCGIYTSPVPNENAVHDLEHGAVWITYQPNLAKSQVNTLTRLVTGQTYLDLSPYPGDPAPVVASAWGVQLKLQSASDPRLAEFVKKYKQGAQTPEPGAPCTGGTGTPVG
jgi:hypothetical protein